MAEYIKKSDLEKHIIREGCDEGCGYIDERDLKDIPTYEVYGTEEVMALLTYLQEEIAKLKSYESSDGQDLVMIADIGILFDQKINALKGDKE